MATKIRKEQININEFIQAVNNTDWNSDTLTASAASILSKIREEIGGVVGSMNFAGTWGQLPEGQDDIIKGDVYVYDGTGISPTGTTLENGDMLIAKHDGSSWGDPDDWAIVQANITGAITDANVATKMSAAVSVDGAIQKNIFFNPGGGIDGFQLKGLYPTIATHNEEDGMFVTGASISTNGVITLTRSSVPSVDVGAKVVFDESVVGNINGSNKVFKTAGAIGSTTTPRAALYINGVRQHAGTDYALSVESSTNKGVFTLSTNAYTPKSGDVVTCDYIKS